MSAETSAANNLRQTIQSTPLSPQAPDRIVDSVIPSPDSGEGSAMLLGEHLQHPDGQRPHEELPVTDSRTARRRHQSLHPHPAGTGRG